MEMMVQAGGGEVWVRDSGGEGVPVVLLHPGWGDSGIWDEIAGRLADEVRVVRYDSLGYGESSAPTERYTALAELRAVLDRLRIERAVLAGHSGGGATALSLALAEPDRVAELLLLAPGVSGYPWPADDPFLAGVSAAAQAGDVEGAVGLGLRAWARAGAGEAVETQIRSAVAGMERQAPFLDEDPPVYDRLGELWDMVARSAYTQLRYSPALLAGTLTGLLWLYVLPPAAAVGGLAAAAAGGGAAAWWLAGAGIAGWAIMAASYVPMLRLYGLSPLRAPGLPLIALMYAGMTADSGRRHHAGRGGEWKGRTIQDDAADRVPSSP